MSGRPKALIIGGGIAGPVTAIFLKKAGIDAELFEAWPYSTGIGGGLQIAPNGMHVLAEIGLATEMIRRGSIAESFDFHSQSGARLGSINQNMRQRFGQPAVNMCRATLNDSADQQGLVRECRVAVREAAGRHRGPRRQARRRAFRRRLVCRGRFRDRRRWRAFRGARACRSGWPKAVRHRPDRLWRFRSEIAARRMRRSASAWRRRSGRAASSVTASAVPMKTMA